MPDLIGHPVIPGPDRESVTRDLIAGLPFTERCPINSGMTKTRA